MDILESSDPDTLEYIAGWIFVLRSLTGDGKLRMNELLALFLYNACSRRNWLSACRELSGKVIIELLRNGKIDAESLEHAERVFSMNLADMLRELVRTLQKLSE